MSPEIDYTQEITRVVKEVAKAVLANVQTIIELVGKFLEVIVKLLTEGLTQDVKANLAKAVTTSGLTV